MKAATAAASRVAKSTEISIHAAREGGDSSVVIAVYIHMIFQSTPPVKAATTPTFKWCIILKFQSTPPVKAATMLSLSLLTLLIFQSTPPVKAATGKAES